MIKPNTLCMIRGVPRGTSGGDCNGKIVTVIARRGEIYEFEPALFTKVIVPGYVDRSPEQYLYPFEDFDPGELDVTHKELETV